MPRLPDTLRFLFLLILACTLQVGSYAQFPAASPELRFATGSASKVANAVVQTEQLRAELIALAPDGIGAGKPLWLGLQLNHQPGWHTYWKNPGDSGLSTQLHWELPKGLQAGDIDWPTPEKIRIGSLANFGYEGQVLLPVPVRISNNFSTPASAENLTVTLNASWLVCRQECVPQDGHFVLNIPLRGSTALHAADFERAQQAAPLAGSGKITLQVTDRGLSLQAQGLPSAWQGKNINAFIETADIIETAGAPSSKDPFGTQSWQADGSWSAHMPLSSLRSSAPKTLAFVLGSGAQSQRFEAPVRGTWPNPSSLSTPGAVATATANAPVIDAPVSEGTTGLWLPAVLGAVLGGLILNLMPCVFPVLAIKVLAFARPTQGARGGHRAQGLAYTAGVILSCLALGALLLALRAGGEQLGWGFQLQSPSVIAFLAILFTLIGMNLMGWLEFGQWLPGNLASMQLRHPVGDAFLSGMLAVAIASPCTAPFMGASVGYAIALPAFQALAIFAALGLGLALPYLIASWVPGTARWMPRPGLWMDTLRRFMAFPMWATVVWLLWVLGHLSGIDGAFSLLALLLCLALLVWTLGLSGRSRTVLATIAAAGLVALATNLGPAVFHQEDTAAPESTSSTAPGPSSATWQAWSAERVTSEMAAGKPVFVDFTAAWCITSQYNTKTTLANPDVMADFAAKGVTLLRADWTRRDPSVTQALSQIGRSGVPVYVLYQAGQSPRVLSEILTVQAVRGELARL